MSKDNEFPGWHGTTIVAVRKGNKVVIAGDGQVSVGQTVMKHNAKKVRRLAGGKVIGGFAGATADAFTLFERLEAKLEQYPDQLMRAAVELAKDWRTDRYLRRLEAMMIVADKKETLVVTGTGDVLTPDHDDHRHRLGRQLRLFGRAGAGREHRPRRRGDRPQGDEDRGRDLHLHQRERDGRNHRDRRVTFTVAAARRGRCGGLPRHPPRGAAEPTRRAFGSDYARGGSTGRSTDCWPSGSSRNFTFGAFDGDGSGRHRRLLRRGAWRRPSTAATSSAST